MSREYSYKSLPSIDAKIEELYKHALLVLHLGVPGVGVVVVAHPHPHVVRLLVGEPVHAVGRRHHPPAMV